MIILLLSIIAIFLLAIVLSNTEVVAILYYLGVKAILLVIMLTILFVLVFLFLFDISNFVVSVFVTFLAVSGLIWMNKYSNANINKIESDKCHNANDIKYLRKWENPTRKPTVIKNGKEEIQRWG